MHSCGVRPLLLTNPILHQASYKKLVNSKGLTPAHSLSEKKGVDKSPTPFQALKYLLRFRGHFRNDLEEIVHDTVIGPGKNRGLGILIDRDDIF